MTMKHEDAGIAWLMTLVICGQPFVLLVNGDPVARKLYAKCTGKGAFLFNFADFRTG